MSSVTASIWSSDPEQLVQCRLDGGETVVFDKATGETHFLNELSVLVLERVGVSGVTSEALLNELHEWSGVSLNEDLRSKVLNTLKVLERAELVHNIAVSVR